MFPLLAIPLGVLGVLCIPALIGFSAIGPIAGSLAAAWQATIGLVAAGSVFAILQSLTMTWPLALIGCACLPFARMLACF